MSSRISGGPVSLVQALGDITKNVPECLATGWIDLAMDTPIKVNPVEDQPQAVLDLIAASIAEILQGVDAVALKGLFNQGPAKQGRFREIVVLTHHFIHVFAWDTSGDGGILVIVTRISANLCAVIRQTRVALAQVREAN